MKKSILNLVTSVKGRLLEFPGIVNSIEQKDLLFMKKLMSWITALEELFLTYNISEASELAGLRSKILAPAFSGSKRNAVRKTQLKIASEILYDLQHTVLEVLTPYESRIEESRELIRQLLTIVSQTKTISYDCDQPFDHLVNDIWRFISSHEQLKAGAVKLKTSLIMSDIQLLIAEEIDLKDF